MVRYLFYTIGDLTYQSPLVHVMKVWRGALLFKLGARLRVGVNPTPRPFYPRERPGCVGLWADLDGCGEISPKSGFELQTVQPVASRYID